MIKWRVVYNYCGTVVQDIVTASSFAIEYNGILVLYDASGRIKAYRNWQLCEQAL